MYKLLYLQTSEYQHRCDYFVALVKQTRVGTRMDYPFQRLSRSIPIPLQHVEPDTLLTSYRRLAVVYENAVALHDPKSVSKRTKRFIVSGGVDPRTSTQTADVFRRTFISSST